MEANCSLCNLLIFDYISFSCNHIFCFLCFNSLVVDYYALGTDFTCILNDNLSIICSICKEGYHKNNLKNLLDFFKQKQVLYSTINVKINDIDKSNESTEEKSFKDDDSKELLDFKQILCQECYQTADFYCVNCRISLCNICDYHSKYKSLISHELINIKNQQIKKLNIKSLIDNKFSSFNNLIENLSNVLLKLKNLNSKLSETQQFIIDNIDKYSKSLENAENYINLKNISLDLINFSNGPVVESEDVKLLSLNFDFDPIYSTIDLLQQSQTNFIQNLTTLVSTLQIKDKEKSLSQMNLNQSIEAENIQLIYRPNIFAYFSKNNQNYLVWPEKNFDLLIYSMNKNEITVCLVGHKSQISSVKYYIYEDILLSTGEENILWKTDGSIVKIISGIGNCFAGELIIRDLVLVPCIVKSNVNLFSINSTENTRIISQENSILSCYSWKNIFTGEWYLILCGMQGDEYSTSIVEIFHMKSYSSYRKFYGPKGVFIVKSDIYYHNGKFNIIYISQNGELIISELDSGILIKKFKFFSLCDFYMWDERTIILLGDELNNYIIYSLTTQDVCYISNKDHSYSINAVKINCALVVLDSNNTFKIFN